jgi:predicted N-acyltransferase
MELSFSSFDDYLMSLGRATRKDIRRKLKNAYSKARIHVQITDDVTEIVDDVYRLYLNTYDEGEVKFERLTREFFLNVSKNKGFGAKFFLYYVNGKLGAFNLCLIHDNLFIDKFIGFDYDISYEHNLYFTSWCYNVQWCIEHSIQYYQTGQTEYAPKVQLGGALIPLYAYIRHSRRARNFILQVLARCFVRGDKSGHA